MKEAREDKLESPAFLGAPMKSSLSPRLSRRLDGYRNGMGRESARMILLSLVGCMLAIMGLAFLGNVLNAYVW